MERSFHPEPTLTETSAQTFSRDELWVLQRTIRHEVPARETWGGYPPASAELNDQIAAALLLCEEQHVDEAALLLSRGDCYTIDYCVPNDLKDVNGLPVGRRILLKSFIARRAITAERDGEIALYPDVDEPAAAPDKRAIAAQLAAGREEWDREPAADGGQPDGGADD